MGACVALQACTTSANPVYGNIGYEGATLYTDATGKTSAGELQSGEIVEWDDNQKTAYVKVRNIATGAEGYVDTLAINRAQYPLEAPRCMSKNLTSASCSTSMPPRPARPPTDGRFGKTATA